MSIPKPYIKIQEGRVSALLDVVIFKEDGITFAYAPSLELVGYGHTLAEAQNSFENVFQEYLKYGMENRTLDEDLRAHGWKAGQSETFNSPQFLVVLRKNKRLQDVISMDHKKESKRFNYSFC